MDNLVSNTVVSLLIGSVTDTKNRPSSYRFTQANQRNSWSILDLTSEIPLKVAFFLDSNLRRNKLTVLYINYQSSKSYITALSYAHKVARLASPSELISLSVSLI